MQGPFGYAAKSRFRDHIHVHLSCHRSGWSRIYRCRWMVDKHPRPSCARVNLTAAVSVRRERVCRGRRLAPQRSGVELWVTKAPNQSTSQQSSSHPGRGFTTVSERTPRRDGQIATGTAPVLRRRSGSQQQALGLGCGKLFGAAPPATTQILGHNSEEGLASSASTGVASGAMQLFAYGPTEELGRRLASAFEPERNRR